MRLSVTRGQECSAAWENDRRGIAGLRRNGTVHLPLRFVATSTTKVATDVRTPRALIFRIFHSPSLLTAKESVCTPRTQSKGQRRGNLDLPCQRRCAFPVVRNSTSARSRDPNGRFAGGCGRVSIGDKDRFVSQAPRPIGRSAKHGADSKPFIHLVLQDWLRACSYRSKGSVSGRPFSVHHCFPRTACSASLGLLREALRDLALCLAGVVLGLLSKHVVLPACIHEGLRLYFYCTCLPHHARRVPCIRARAMCWHHT